MWVKTELIDCPLCGSKEFDEVAVRSDNLRIVKCRSCNLGFLNPRPVEQELYKLYEKDYYSNQQDKRIIYKSFAPSTHRIKYYKPYAMDILTGETTLRDKRALDIGCSFGKWVYWMAKAGAKAVGIDLAQQCVEWGRQNLELDLRQCSISNIGEPAGSFDVITMIELIEHISDIRDFIKNLVRLLKPGGLAFVQTPNFESYYKWRQNWLYLDFGLEHLLYFDTATLDKLFAEYGMIPCRQTCVLNTIPCDREGFFRQQRGLKRRLASYLLQLPPFCDFVHRGLSVLLTSRYTYKYDTSRQSGNIIMGCYRKN